MWLSHEGRCCVVASYSDIHNLHLSFIVLFAYQGLLFITFRCVRQHRKQDSGVSSTLKYINDKLSGKLLKKDFTCCFTYGDLVKWMSDLVRLLSAMFTAH